MVGRASDLVGIRGVEVARREVRRRDVVEHVRGDELGPVVALDDGDELGPRLLRLAAQVHPVHLVGEEVDRVRVGDPRGDERRGAAIGGA